MSTLRRIRAVSQASIHENYHTNDVGVAAPPLRPAYLDDVDDDQIRFWSTIVEQGQWSLPRVVRHLRGQTATDPRPNKDLFEVATSVDPAIAATVHQWNQIVQHGVVPRWTTGLPPTQSTRPRNHAGIRSMSAQIRRHLRAGQLERRYLIVDSRLVDQWPELFISPLGAIAKASSPVGDIRLINDYSIPHGQSVTDFTDRSNFPSISYIPPRDITKRIHHLSTSHVGECISMMLGDVASAFRHLPIHADSVHVFAFIFDNLLVIDLACGFGWCGSPAFYSLASTIINALYEHGNRLMRQFTGNVWCNDHTCIEVDVKTRCADANISLRQTMATVLGPTAINELKFTTWSTKCKALGLLWDTETATVSIPADKLAKASTRVHKLLATGKASRTTMLKAIGSLRHVASCFSPARSFLQSLQEAAARSPKYGRRALSQSSLDDLRWFVTVLHNPQRFNSIPVIYFADTSAPQYHVFMDASGDGLCTLEPSLKTYIRQPFSQEDIRDTSINVRELRSAVLVALHWGSQNPVAQMYNRLLSLAEFQYNLVFTASHIAGKLNVMADAGSRVWTADHPLANLWTNLSCSWTQTHLAEPFENLSAVWDRCCVATPWQTLPPPRTLGTGTNGEIRYKNGVDPMAHSVYSVKTTRILRHILLGGGLEHSRQGKPILHDQAKARQHPLVSSPIQRHSTRNKREARTTTPRHQAALRSPTEETTADSAIPSPAVPLTQSIWRVRRCVRGGPRGAGVHGARSCGQCSVRAACRCTAQPAVGRGGRGVPQGTRPVIERARRSSSVDGSPIATRNTRDMQPQPQKDYRNKWCGQPSLRARQANDLWSWGRPPRPST
ncbi:unnamed protein product [Phytophthora fragariaefolia]|uniref:Unnamed protein product n=1 Tax=Phytophthora fragariaefolia TaxID=1490495 RepID=A0A9W6XPI7_9STRA|nr:unnamed protein product [Phytophthora fragariaefolia]